MKDKMKKRHERIQRFQTGALVVLGALGLLGCDSQVGSFIKGAVPANVVSLPSIRSDGPTQLKVSPGQMNASSPQMSINANVTINNRVLSSANMSASISISRSRSGQQ